MSQAIDSERERLRRIKAQEMSSRVAAFLADFEDDLTEEGLLDDCDRTKVIVAVAPVVMDMAMKGIFK